MSENCVFCKIINQELPSNVIYENENLIAILDIDPISEGHTLVIPKIHVDKMYEVPDNILKNVIIMIKKIVLAMDILNFNILQNNGEIAYQALHHVHWHIIPKRNEDEGLKIEWKPCIALSGRDLADPTLIYKYTNIATEIRNNLIL